MSHVISGRGDLSPEQRKATDVHSSSHPERLTFLGNNKHLGRRVSSSRQPFNCGTIALAWLIWVVRACVCARLFVNSTRDLAHQQLTGWWPSLSFDSQVKYTYMIAFAEHILWFVWQNHPSSPKKMLFLDIPLPVKWIQLRAIWRLVLQGKNGQSFSIRFSYNKALQYRLQPTKGRQKASGEEVATAVWLPWGVITSTHQQRTRTGDNRAPITPAFQGPLDCYPPALSGNEHGTRQFDDRDWSTQMPANLKHLFSECDDSTELLICLSVCWSVLQVVGCRIAISRKRHLVV